jgi:hypothetical protein
LKREAAISLLKKVLANCDSAYNAQVVSIGNGKNADGWELTLNWIPSAVEKNYLNEIAAADCFEILFKSEQTAFRTPIKHQ